MSKAALEHLTRTLDLEFRPAGIRVTAVAPQLIDTSYNRDPLRAGFLAHAVAPEGGRRGRLPEFTMIWR